MSATPPLRIATRSSPLALWQANHVAELLRKVTSGPAVEVVEVSTAGDRDQVDPLAGMGGVGVFTREVQYAVLDGRADLAVHSLKDLPTQTAQGLILAGVPERAPRYDVLVLPADADESGVSSLNDLPAGARIGTGSPRRQAQLLHRRGDLKMMPIRGNVETRLRRLDEGEYDAIVLAQAGLMRLRLDAGRKLLPLEPPLMYPAVGQAALGIESRADDDQTRRLLEAITDAVAMTEVTAERACLRELGAGCHAPVGTLATISGSTLTLAAVVLSADGTQRIEAQRAGDVSETAAIGRELARLLFQRGAGPLIN
jgi:hydroxymethylbilane synthase